MNSGLEISRDEGVLILTLNRPEKKNALSNAIYEALCVAFESASSDASVRAVLLRGAGDCFTAGNDLADFAAIANGQAEEPKAMKFLEVLLPFEKPLIAAVHGLAFNMGIVPALLPGTRAGWALGWKATFSRAAGARDDSHGN